MWVLWGVYNCGAKELMHMNQKEALEIIRSGENTAHGLLYDVMPTASTRFHRLSGQLAKLMDEINRHFPDASFYSASGSFCLLLGDSHDEGEQPQQDLLAHTAVSLYIEGGDW